MTQTPLDEVYRKTFHVFPNDNPADIMKYYNKNGTTYDSTMKTMTYIAPDVAAQKAASLVSDKQKENFKLLDLGAGTGLSGAALRRSGFLGNISALDGSAEMLKVATEKGIYSDSTEHILTSSNPLPYPDHSFEMVVSVATFTKHLMEPDCLEEVLRVLKPHSYMIITIRMYSEVQDYKVRFYDELDRLEAAGLMKICSSEKFPYYKWDKISDEFKVNLADQYGDVLVLQKLDIN
uniref:Ubiquinone/menaquinone biosynthesis C-methyltransferase UbiE-like n=1 Tax=Ciona intestinalis TaxID=7719 RepID=F6Q929_CIOIN|nr:uncharacterized protein LOC100181888 [Ciona intestinalis]|eukprot:XP_002130510.1 uncharacterized protein LOC100181888 [Ciona intestinalis]